MKKKLFLTLILLSISAAGIFTSAYSADGQLLGKISETSALTREIIVRAPKSGENILLGDKLYVRIDGEVVIMESTNPMMSLSKCKLLPAHAKYFNRLTKDMPVYKYYAGMEKKEEVVQKVVEEPKKAGEEKNIGGIEMVYIPAGSFMMGAVDGDSKASESEKPRHKVTVDSFYMGKYDVTQAQYAAVTGNHPGEFTDKPNNPVENVLWYEAIEFCNKLSTKAGLRQYYVIDKKNKDPFNRSFEDPYKWTVRIQIDANGFRLPTEAEWEYADRAGTTTTYYWGESIDKTVLDQYVVYQSDSYVKGLKNSKFSTSRVGTKKPNAFGLYDMNGHVWQWCWDWYDDITYYKFSPSSNPKGPIGGDNRVLRGGSNASYVRTLSASSRSGESPEIRGENIGFRVVSASR